MLLFVTFITHTGTTALGFEEDRCVKQAAVICFVVRSSQRAGKKQKGDLVQ